MNIKRLKKIIVVYLIAFVAMCIFVPCNVYFDGYIYASQEPIKAQYGLQIKPINEIGYEDIFRSQYIPVLKKEIAVKGILVTKLNVSVMVAELVALSVLFAGVSYVTCKKE
jgi:hypothetical protein